MTACFANPAVAAKAARNEYTGPDGALALGLDQFKRNGNMYQWSRVLWGAMIQAMPKAKNYDVSAMLTVAWCRRHLKPLIGHFRDMAYVWSDSILQGIPIDEYIEHVSVAERQKISEMLAAWGKYPRVGGKDFTLAAHFFKTWRP